MSSTSVLVTTQGFASRTKTEDSKRSVETFKFRQVMQKTTASAFLPCQNTLSKCAIDSTGQSSRKLLRLTNWYRIFGETIALRRQIIIFTPGHCGSTSLAAVVPRGVQCHSFVNTNPFRYSKKNPLRIIYAYFRVLERILLAKNHSIKIAILINDPLTINVNGFFHNLHHFISKEILLHPNLLNEMSCTDSFVEEVFYRRYPHDKCNKWARKLKHFWDLKCLKNFNFLLNLPKLSFKNLNQIKILYF